MALTSVEAYFHVRTSSNKFCTAPTGLSYYSIVRDGFPDHDGTRATVETDLLDAGGTARGPDLERLGADLVESARVTRLVATPDLRSCQLPMRREVNAELAGDALLRVRIVEAGTALLMSDAMPQGQVVPNLRLVLPGSLQEPVAPLVQYGHMWRGRELPERR